MTSIRIALGEVLDRLSILELKLEHGAPDAARRERDSLASALWRDWPGDGGGYDRMLSINRRLWQLEDRMRDLEDGGSDAETAAVGRAIAATNRERSAWKGRVNEGVGHPAEFKSYGGCGAAGSGGAPGPG